LDSRGIPHSELRDSEGFASIDFVDPDGIQIEMSFLDRDMRLQRASIALAERGDSKTV
jgi:hypothetical protein